MLRAIACVAAVASAAGPAAALEIVVPAYFYPGPLWSQMNTAAGQVPLTAIMNPFNGPGNAPDNNYTNAVDGLRSAGGRVIGYVYSGYGSRPLAEVTADIDRYASWYGIDGIFVDEMANTGPAERLNYYKAIYDHVKSIDPQWEVMGNPGTTTIEQYLTWPTADRLMVFENVGAAYPGSSPSAWTAGHDNEHFVNLVHTESSTTNMLAALDQAVAQNVGAIYVTHDALPNPWDTLPTYWTSEVARVAEINASYSPADFNQDGAVDGDDLARWTTNFGSAGVAGKFGDATNDGVVDGADLLVWQRQLSSIPLVQPALQYVPEPSSVTLIAMTATLVVCCTQRKQAPR
ncbi:MAG: hypothetical protein KDA44_06410 [Planctomycetales bacterium]|nr:hypothetical protein [Planctomycetales bacterium]